MHKIKDYFCEQMAQFIFLLINGALVLSMNCLLKDHGEQYGNILESQAFQEF